MHDIVYVKLYFFVTIASNEHNMKPVHAYISFFVHFTLLYAAYVIAILLKVGNYN